MKRFRVLFAPQARDDLDALFAYIAEHAGRNTARRFVGELRAYCLGFELAPERGRRRDDLVPGLRLVGYRRRATIAFPTTSDEVVILRILARGRDVDGLVSTDDNKRD